MGKPKKKRQYSGRDLNMVAILKGATKSGIQKDLKKEANKLASRSKEEKNEARCIQCHFPYDYSYSRNLDEITAMECGFCSVSCMDYHGSIEE